MPKAIRFCAGADAKFVNHSFNPSCFSTAYDFEIAIRDIHPGEQLTDDYGYLNLEEPFEAEEEGTDRKVVYPDDIVTYHEEWDALILKNLPYIFDTAQPLLPYLDKQKWHKFRRLENNPSELISILECYCRPQKEMYYAM
ncbi:SET domain-containing protein-lysine N-methyltransferase [Flavobacterium sp. 3HN19-14]|uniref:SET domain-containing protein-lysine N-methyltransferase n=1 Tax=Flavobacterium sp. 3HN19-14 TaxID=3448133 RepID=UPI003EE3E52B